MKLAKMKDASKTKPLGVRMPDALKDWLKKQALANRRSLNSEILARLEDSQRREQATATAQKEQGHE